MILSKALSSKKISAPLNSTTTQQTLPQVVELMGGSTRAGQVVTPESSRNVATAYRCLNILSDDVAKLPLQVYMSRQSGEVERMRPDAMMRNLAWLTERQPNRWWSPFQFKKQLMQWLVAWGNGYVWTPPAYPREQFILHANRTTPIFDVDGNLWYRTQFSANGKFEYIPDVEVMHVLINPDETGFVGRGVIKYARETIGRQLAAYGSQSTLFKNGLSAAGIMWLAGESKPEERKRVREMYEEVMSGDENNGRIAVLDKKVTKFEPVTLSPRDVQFLQLIADNDIAVMNFFGMPSYKLNTGKQSYQSNEQNNLDYLSTTLDPYLVQIEQAGGLKWLSLQEQGYTYLRFERSALFRTDAKSRGDYLNGAIQNGRLCPNEARQIEDRSADPNPLANQLWMASNLAPMSNTQTQGV
ncbi:MAG: phage portal protein [Chloroflexi bacterium]|nr:phage portal protein [Chloroflexota bacterium]